MAGYTPQRPWPSPGMIAHSEQAPARWSLVDSILQGAEVGSGVSVQPLQQELASKGDNTKRCISAEVSPGRAHRHAL